MSSYNASSITTVNWMHTGLSEWTMTPNSSSSDTVFSLDYNGTVYSNISSANSFHEARPVFYLKASVAYAGGAGTQSSPITLKLS